MILKISSILIFHNQSQNSGNSEMLLKSIYISVSILALPSCDHHHLIPGSGQDIFLTSLAAVCPPFKFLLYTAARSDHATTGKFLRFP